MTVKCGVGVVLMTLENTFLIGKRLESGLYGLPGGSIEFGEQVVRTAQRELYEETRLRVPLEQFTPFKVLNCIKEDYHTFDEELGSGAYKSVWKAIDNDNGCEVAWNIVKTTSLSKAEKERVRQEIEIIKKLKHPNIIHFISAWHNREKEEVVFITEIMSGGSMKHYLKRLGKPRLRVIKQWCRGILTGLAFLHSQEPYPIIHRDLKCDNIFVVSSTAEIRVGDLGLSTFMTSSCNKTLVGTPQYMAPELFDERYGPSVDIYAFGLCVLEMVTQAIPYSECRTPVEVYRKLTQGIKPQALSSIQDSDVKEFIEICISHVDTRPTANELLKHPFLEINDADGRTHLPVTVGVEATDEEKTAKLSSLNEKGPNALSKPAHKKVQIIDLINFEEETKDARDGIIAMAVTLGVKNQRTGVVESKQLNFEYKMKVDTPESVAQELLESLQLNNNYLGKISAIIREKIVISQEEQYARNDSFLNVFLNTKEKLAAGSELNQEEVRVLQEMLGVILGKNIHVTGNFDKNTEEAVREFQAFRRLNCSGAIDNETLDALVTDYQKRKLNFKY